MQNNWNDKEASQYESDPVELRAYTSRLLGQNFDLVLHGGGNTSLKHVVKDIFNEEVPTLFIKGSGYDLKTLPRQGLSPCRLQHLLKLAKCEKLSDSEMVSELRSSLLDPHAPTPSVETIVHALIPFKYVDHTHADAIVAISNTAKGEEYLKEIFGPRVLILPYIMPGFVLAKQIYAATFDLKWEQYDGIILLNHGIFTFSEDGKKCYDQMIHLVSKAEQFLKDKNILEDQRPTSFQGEINPLDLAFYRQECSKLAGRPMLASFRPCFISRPDLVEKGPLTPDHVIHTKRIGGVVKNSDWVKDYAKNYREYFEEHKSQGLALLDQAPRYSVVRGQGVCHFAFGAKSLQVVEDIIEHTLKAIDWSEKLGGWKVLSPAQIFEVEYWELEQAKLKKLGTPKPFEGKVAFVTGAASGIGKAITMALLKEGMAVVGCDLSPSVLELAKGREYLGLVMDVTSSSEITKALAKAVCHFGGVDLLVSNAGNFPVSTPLAEMNDELWGKTLGLNLTSHQKLLREAIPYLKKGIDPLVIFMGSKNVPAPGPGAAHYSVAKAGLTQLARVASLELAPFGIRAMTLHPDAVFDTGLWNPEVLTQRASNYSMSVEDYKKKNLLKTDITSNDIAKAVVALAGPSFLKSTGLQISIDGGNDRVI